jgi:hypothetical protein
MADKKQKPAFTHMRWSEADDKLLRELIERGADGTTISKTLGRTRSSIFNRKFVLGIEQAMKKTKKGQTNDLTFGTKTRSTEPQPAPVLEVKQVPAPTPTPTKAKKEPKVKVQLNVAKEKGKAKIPYNFKLAQVNQRRRRGDIAKIAASTGFSQGYVSTVVNGLQDNERIVSVAYNMARGRKTNETMMKK